MSGNNESHVAGISCLIFISMNKFDLIIDSGVADYIRPHKSILTDIQKLEFPYGVTFPNDSVFLVTHISKCCIKQEYHFS